MSEQNTLQELQYFLDYFGNPENVEEFRKLTHGCEK